MTKFAFNNAKNANTDYMPFEFNYGYHPCISFTEDTNPYCQLKTAKKLSSKLRKLNIVCQKNLHHGQ